MAEPIQILIVVTIVGGIAALIAVYTLRLAVRRRTDELAESRARFRRLAEATFEGIILHADGEIVDVNHVLTEMIGYERAELVGREVSTVLSDATRNLGRPPRERSEGAYEAVIVRKDGSSFPAEIEEKQVDAGSGDVHVAAVRNITDRKKRERALLLAKEEAEKMAQLKSSLLNNMSHELRTPVTSIIGYAELIRDEPTADHSDFAERIRKSGQRLSRTLRSVLEMAHIESGSRDVEPELVKIGALIQDVIAEHEEWIEEKELSVAVQTTESEPIYTDDQLLHRSLSNLIHNAVKFTTDGEVRVVVEADDSRARIQVVDTGIGIDPEFMDSLFDPFQQESDGRGRTHEGMGLGLTLAKRMINLLEGTIEVESEKGEGTLVRVHVPSHTEALDSAEL